MFLNLLYLSLSLLLVAGLSMLLAVLVISRKIREQIDEIFSSDTKHLHKRLEALKSRHPEASRDELLEKLIRREMLHTGLIGFFAGLGGVITLPIALPLDILSTLKIQYRLANFILHLDDVNEPEDNKTEGLKSMALVFGYNQLSDLGGKLTLKLIVKYTPQTLLKSVPLAGGVAGFFLNYCGTRAVGTLAMKRATAAREQAETDRPDDTEPPSDKS